MSINSEDRWKSIIDKLKYGEDRGVERVFLKKTTQYVYVGGRKMPIKEANVLSGIDKHFFEKYIGREVPIEEIVRRLDIMWVRDKAKKLRMSELLK